MIQSDRNFASYLEENQNYEDAINEALDGTGYKYNRYDSYLSHNETWKKSVQVQVENLKFVIKTQSQYMDATEAMAYANALQSEIALANVLNQITDDFYKMFDGQVEEPQPTEVEAEPVSDSGIKKSDIKFVKQNDVVTAITVEGENVGRIVRKTEYSRTKKYIYVEGEYLGEHQNQEKTKDAVLEHFDRKAEFYAERRLSE